MEFEKTFNGQYICIYDITLVLYHCFISYCRNNYIWINMLIKNVKENIWRIILN